MTLSILAFAPMVFALASGSGMPIPTPAEIENAERLDRQYQQDYARQFGRIERSLRESSSPRDWVLAVQLYKPWDPAARPDADTAKGLLLRRAAEAAPNNRFVQWAWATALPAASGCDAPHPCPDRTAALAILEPDNGAAWFPVLNEAWESKDARAIDLALGRMAEATRFDDLFVESVAVWSDMYRRFPVNTLDADPSTVFARAAALASVGALPSLIAMRACYLENQRDAPASRLAVCGRIGRMMMTHGTTMLARQAGRSFLRSSGNLTPADVDAGRQMDWLLHQHSRLSIERSPALLRAYGDDMQATGSEVAAAVMQVERAGLSQQPPPGWKSSYEKYYEAVPERPVRGASAGQGARRGRGTHESASTPARAVSP